MIKQITCAGNQISIWIILIALFSFSAPLNAQSNKPALFAQLDETCATPDGLAIDANGNLYLSITNATTFNKYGAKILRFDADNKPQVWCDSLPLHPISKQVHPMGMSFDRKGNLYVVDNQIFSGLRNSSRILKITIENNQIKSIKAIVSGLNFANGIKFYNNNLFVTDSWTGGKKQSAVYRFPLDEQNTGTLNLDSLNKNNYLLHTFTMADSIANDVGADGIEFDNSGNMYVGNFSDGSITKFALTKKGNIKTVEVIYNNPDLKCCDGIYYHKKKNALYIANFTNNSIHTFNLNTNTMTKLWENDNDNGQNGLLDNPCEIIYYQGKFLVVNFDTFTTDKNKEVDSVNTISEFSSGF
ncbi:MAG: hypothetical protein ACRC3B_15585 [Bacteroidia bacterium]